MTAAITADAYEAARRRAAWIDRSDRGRILVSGPDREGKVQLKRGSWNIQSHIRRLAAANAPPAEPAARPAAVTWSTDEAAPIEVDLRGMDVSDAIAELDRGVDRAVLAGFSELRVIHGIGRGVLRTKIVNARAPGTDGIDGAG